MDVAIPIIRYLVLPLAGLVVGWRVMRWTGPGQASTEGLGTQRKSLWLPGLLALGVVVMGGMVTARYETWHSFVFDLGAYDQKAWLIAHEANWRGMWAQTYRGGIHLSPCGLQRYWGVCHFQPWLLVPGIVYRVWDSPLVLLWSQVLLVVSGVIPVFLLTRDRFDSSVAGVLAGGLYLLYPAVQYNGVVDYRPDHLAIPTMLWAYLLAARGRYLASLGVAGLGGLAKETLILNAAFFGLYLAVRYRQRLLGATAFAGGLAVFFVVTFHFLQFTTVSEGQFMIHRYYPELSTAAAGDISAIVASPMRLLRRTAEVHKLLYLNGLFAPLALLPFLAWAELIPAIPSLAISLLSTNSNLASVESQYSASVIGPVFAATFTALAALARGPWMRAGPIRALRGLVVCNLVVSLGLAPSMLSLNFWNPQWGGRWQEAQYRPDRQTALTQAALLVPTDPNVMVVTQNDVNSARLARHYDFFAFPYGLDRADFVLLDTARQPYVYWTWDPERYEAIVSGLRVDPAYQVIFDQEGVLLFKHRETFGAGLPAVPR